MSVVLLDDQDEYRAQLDHADQLIDELVERCDGLAAEVHALRLLLAAYTDRGGP